MTSHWCEVCDRDIPGSTATHNPERQDPTLGDSEPCPTPKERVAIEDREAEVRLWGEQHVAELEKEANK